MKRGSAREKGMDKRRARHVRGRRVAGNRLWLTIRCIDTAGGSSQESGASAGHNWGANEPFYGTMAGPWWYHTATSVPRVRNLPFSLLRMLMQLSRRADIPVRCKDRTLPGFETPLPLSREGRLTNRTGFQPSLRDLRPLNSRTQR